MNISRDADGVAHIVALSGGKDSTAMALMLQEREPRPYAFVCTPTGDELPAMFEHWRKLGKTLGSPLISLQAETLERCVERNRAIPNWRMRFCTRELKIEPFQAFLLKASPAISYVGLRADEDDREGARYHDKLNIEQRFPLREWGMGIEDVYQCLNNFGVNIPERTDCARCFFQRLGEWWVLWKKYPDIYADAEQQEERMGATWRSLGRDTWPAPLCELRQLFEAGKRPEISLRMMEKRKMMCRRCSM